MDAAADRAKANAQEAGAKMDAKLDAAGNKMDAMGDAAAKSARETKENMKAAAKQ
jgi:F0F1-type ATP synthase membrane subunit b/b'